LLAGKFIDNIGIPKKSRLEFSIQHPVKKPKENPSTMASEDMPQDITSKSEGEDSNIWKFKGKFYLKSNK
jgi:hypothetical protein